MDEHNFRLRRLTVLFYLLAALFIAGLIWEPWFALILGCLAIVSIIIWAILCVLAISNDYAAKYLGWVPFIRARETKKYIPNHIAMLMKDFRYKDMKCYELMALLKEVDAMPLSEIQHEIKVGKGRLDTIILSLKSDDVIEEVKHGWYRLKSYPSTEMDSYNAIKQLTDRYILACKKVKLTDVASHLSISLGLVEAEFEYLEQKGRLGRVNKHGFRQIRN